MKAHLPQPEEVLDFWFAQTRISGTTLAELAARSAVWFGSSPGFDKAIESRFGELPAQGLRGELDDWIARPDATVALLIVLDQFPRNLYRQDSRAFDCDARALEIAGACVAAGHDQLVTPVEATFAYLPFEHAEKLDAQDRSVSLYEALARRVDVSVRDRFESFTEYARRHQRIIVRFGRFPHRNQVLGRESTPEECAYLESGGESFGG